MPSPIIFLTFSQDRETPGRYLDALALEKEEIRNTLHPFDEEIGRVKFAISSDPKNWVREVQQYQKDMVIFHFSGHAGSEFLQFELSNGRPSQLRGEIMANLFTREVAPIWI